MIHTVTPAAAVTAATASGRLRLADLDEDCAALGVGVAVVSMEAPFVTFSYFDIVELTAFSSFFLFLLRYIDPKRGIFVEMRYTYTEGRRQMNINDASLYDQGHN